MGCGPTLEVQDRGFKNTNEERVESEMSSLLENASHIAYQLQVYWLTLELASLEVGVECGPEKWISVSTVRFRPRPPVTLTLDDGDSAMR